MMARKEGKAKPPTSNSQSFTSANLAPAPAQFANQEEFWGTDIPTATIATGIPHNTPVEAYVVQQQPQQTQQTQKRNIHSERPPIRNTNPTYSPLDYETGSTSAYHILDSSPTDHRGSTSASAPLLQPREETKSSPQQELTANEHAKNMNDDEKIAIRNAKANARVRQEIDRTNLELAQENATQRNKSESSNGGVTTSAFAIPTNEKDFAGYAMPKTLTAEEKLKRHLEEGEARRRKEEEEEYKSIGLNTGTDYATSTNEYEYKPTEYDSNSYEYKSMYDT